MSFMSVLRRRLAPPPPPPPPPPPKPPVVEAKPPPPPPARDEFVPAGPPAAPARATPDHFVSTDGKVPSPAPGAPPVPAAPGQPVLVDPNVLQGPPGVPQPQVGPPPPWANVAAVRVQVAEIELQNKGKSAREAEERLAQQIGAVGAGLTPRELEAFKADYRKRNEAVYREEDAAAAELAAALKDPAAATDTATVQRGYAALANSPSHALEAMEWVNNIAKAQPGATLDPALQDIAADALEKGLPKLLTQDTPEAAFKNLERYAPAFAKVGGGAKEAWATIKDLRQGDPRAYDRLGKLAGAWDSKLSRSLGIAAVAFGSISGVTALQQQQYGKAVEALFGAGSKGLELVAGAAHSFAGPPPPGVAPTALQKFSAGAARFSGVLGVVANGAAAINDFKKFLDGKGGAYAAAAVGDLLSVAGSAAIASGAPPAVLIGALALGVGTLVTGVARTFGAETARDEFVKELKASLQGAGVTGDRVDLYAENFESVSQLGVANVPSGHIETLLRDHPEIFEEKGRLDVLLETSRLAGIPSHELLEFSRRLDVSDESVFRRLEGVIEDHPGVPQQLPLRDQLQLLSYLRDEKPEAFALGQQLSPELYSDASLTRLQAQADLEQVLIGPGHAADQRQPIAQLVHEHRDDPVFLDGLVQYAKSHPIQGDGVQYLFASIDGFRPEDRAVLQAAVDRNR